MARKFYPPEDFDFKEPCRYLSKQLFNPNRIITRGDSMLSAFRVCPAASDWKLFDIDRVTQSYPITCQKMGKPKLSMI